MVKHESKIPEARGGGTCSGGGLPCPGGGGVPGPGGGTWSRGYLVPGGLPGPGGV